MNTGLPESYEQFAKELEFQNMATWDYKKKLATAVEYARIKKLENEERWVLSDVESLIESMCNMEDECSRRKVSYAIPYTEVLDGRLPKKLIDLQEIIWFLPTLAGHKPEAFDKLESRYKSYFNKKISGRNYERARSSLFELLIDYERRYVHDLVFDAVDTPRTKTAEKIGIAKSSYPGITKTTPSSRTILKLNKELTKVGLGVESPSRKKNKKEITIDEHTKPLTTTGKHNIYTPGWSMNGAFDDSDG